MMRPVLLLLLGAHLVYAGTHSLRYFYTAVSGISDFPEYTAVGLLDEGQFYYFDSNIMKAVPKTEWIRQNEGADYWNRETENMIGTHQTFKVNIQTAKERFNQSTGVHTFQQMYGCEWDDTTGTTDGFYQYGYDGEDFIAFDLKNSRWVSPKEQAFLLTEGKWNNDRGLIEGRNNYLKVICLDWLKKYMDYGKNTLQKTVSPKVSLLQKDPSSPVACHTTGFYPSGVTISWKKNGQDHDEDVDLGEIVPNEDGTFQVTSTLNVKPEEWKKNEYNCVVEHKSRTTRSILTEDEIKTNYDSVPIGIIIGVVAAVLLMVVIGVAGYFVYQKRKGFKPVSASDDGSDSSTRTDPHA